MFRLDQTLTVYLHRQPIDFRLNINGLAMLVEKTLGSDPFARCAYVFSNRRRNRVKILLWERSDFWLLMKRMEQDRSILPTEQAVPALTVEQLHERSDSPTTCGACKISSLRNRMRVESAGTFAECEDRCLSGNPSASPKKHLWAGQGRRRSRRG